MFVTLMTITGIGFLMKYVLVAGYKRNLLYDGNVELYFLGFTRHEWGSIHLWLSVFFLLLLAFHIVLHWKMIACIFQCMVPIKLWRIVVVVIIVGISLFMALFSFFIAPKQLLREPHHRNRNDNVDLSPSNQRTILQVEKMSDTARKELNFIKTLMYAKR